MGVPILLSHTIREALGKDCVEKAVIGRIDEQCRFQDDSIRTLDVDLVCVAVGLRPLVELADLARCRLEWVGPLGGFLPLHDRSMRSSRPDIYVAGDLAGIEEASTAMEEGKLAGISAAHALGRVDDHTYAGMAEAVRESLRELRLGSFGEDRRACKERIVAETESVAGGGA